MEDEALACPKCEIKSEVTQKNQANPSNGNKGRNKHKWGQGKPRPPNDKKKLVSKEPLVKRLHGTYPRSNVSIVTTIDI